MERIGHPDRGRHQLRHIDGSNIVGLYTDSDYNTQGFSYDGSTYTTLDVPGASSTNAFGIDGGNIVGEYAVGGGGESSPDYHGFRHDGSTYTTLDLTGAANTSVYGIDGSNIVGWYTDDDYGLHGCIATIPEPSTAALFALGLAGCALVRRRSRSIS